MLYSDSTGQLELSMNNNCWWHKPNTSRHLHTELENQHECGYNV